MKTNFKQAYRQKAGYLKESTEAGDIFSYDRKEIEKIREKAAAMINANPQPGQESLKKAWHNLYMASLSVLKAYESLK